MEKTILGESWWRDPTVWRVRVFVFSRFLLFLFFGFSRGLLLLWRLVSFSRTFHTYLPYFLVRSSALSTLLKRCIPSWKGRNNPCLKIHTFILFREFSIEIKLFPLWKETRSCVVVPLKSTQRNTMKHHTPLYWNKNLSKKAYVFSKRFEEIASTIIYIYKIKWSV